MLSESTGRDEPLEKFKLLQLSTLELAKELSEYIDISASDTEIGVSFRKEYPHQCQIGRQDLLRVLKAFLDGSLKDSELIMWASLVLMMDDNFEIVEETKDWDNRVLVEILHKLADRPLTEPVSEADARYLYQCVQQYTMPEL